MGFNGTGKVLSIILMWVPLSAQATCTNANEGTGSKAKIVSAFEPYLFTDDPAFTDYRKGLDGDFTADGLAKLAPEKRSYCSRGRNRIVDIQYYDQVAFKNPVGKLGLGLCWWMARFQRSINYLGNFFPSRAKPSPAETLKIIQRIKAGNAVVDIPGYSNVYEFTKEHEAEIVPVLDDWQARDALQGVDSILRVGSETPGQLQERMAALHARMFAHPAQLMAKTPIKGQFGATHGIDITDIQPIREGNSNSALKPPVGYRMFIHDSNYPETPRILIVYHFGDTSLHYPSDYEKADSFLKEGFLPNIAHDDELADHENAIRVYCGRPKQ